MQQSQSAPAVKKKQKKRKQWSEELMVVAIDAVKGSESVLHAAKQFGVPRQTWWLSKWQSCSWHETWTKAISNICRREEIILDIAKAGYGKNRKQIMGLAEPVARDKGRMMGQKRSQMGGSGDL